MATAVRCGTLKKMRERRRFARIPLSTQVRVTVPGIEERRQLLLENLSEGGLFIRTPSPKPVGTVLDFEFSVRDGGEPIRGRGVVRWTETDPEGNRGMGIKFLDLDEAARKEILSLLAQRRQT